MSSKRTLRQDQVDQSVACARTGRKPVVHSSGSFPGRASPVVSHRTPESGGHHDDGISARSCRQRGLQVCGSTSCFALRDTRVLLGRPLVGFHEGSKKVEATPKRLKDDLIFRARWRKERFLKRESETVRKRSEDCPRLVSWLTPTQHPAGSLRGTLAITAAWRIHGATSCPPTSRRTSRCSSCPACRLRSWMSLTFCSSDVLVDPSMPSS